MKLSGIYPPICTAFHPDGSLAIGALKGNVQRYNRSPLAGYVVTGSTGEAVMLSTPEKAEVWDAVRSVASPGKKLIAGAAAQSTRETVDLVNIAAAIGYDAALVLTPSFFKAQMSRPETQRNFFQRVADASRIPLILYNFPQMTGIDLDADTMASIVEHPNIIGVKESSADMNKIENLHAALPADCPLLVGASAVFDQCLSVGAAGGILAVANVLPDLSCEIFTRFAAGDHDGAKVIQARIFEVASVPPRFGIQGLKHAMDHVGFFGGVCREPLLPISDEQKREIEKAFGNRLQ